MSYLDLSRRERQIMDVIYRRGEATAADVLEALPDPPSNSAVRTLLRILGEKGHLVFEKQGPRYVYRPSVPREKVKRKALRHLVRTFFDGSPAKAVATLLDLSDDTITPEDLERLAERIEQAKSDGL
ncbi:MAG: BlaI/MecI/CopY family transcriptional regulator [Bacteroidota bacterium]